MLPGEEYPCLGYIIALRGYDGQLLWNLTVRSEVFLMNCEHFDIDFDGKPDCIGTGRQGVVVAFNPYTGNIQSMIVFKNEPRHDKTNKMSVRPAKTQISLGIRPV